MVPRSSLLGLAVETRLAIFGHVLGATKQKTLIPCRRNHLESENQTFEEREGDYHNCILRSFADMARLLKVNRQIADEARLVLFSTLTATFCMNLASGTSDHNTPFRGLENTFTSYPPESINARSYPGPSARCSFPSEPLVDWLQNITTVEISFQYPELEQTSRPLELNLTHTYACGDNLRGLVHGLNQSRSLRKVEIKCLLIEKYDCSMPRNTLKDAFRAFEQLRNYIKLCISGVAEDTSWDFLLPVEEKPESEATKVYVQEYNLEMGLYLQQLQGDKRQSHFAQQISMLKEWVRLRIWVCHAFHLEPGYSVHEPIAQNASPFYFEMDEEIREELGEIVHDAWCSHDRGDKDGFKAAKDKLKTLALKHATKFNEMLDDLPMTECERYIEEKEKGTRE